MTYPAGILHHPTLRCSIRGKPSSSTLQFRNLKYATIHARYKDSIPIETPSVASDEIVDATTFGPSCPQKRGAQAWDLTLVGNVELPCEPGQGHTEAMDEINCLHLNVTVPKLDEDVSVQAKKPLLPVFVWVHGGGLSVGSNNWPQYDLRKLVERSVTVAKPMIAVAVNYRLNVLGFLSSEEIGANGNMGFKDQVLALRWVKKHIEGFGGDPHNITAAGESAGGISLSTLLSANIGEEGLFEKVMIMSGETTLRKPRHPKWHQQLYGDQASYFGIDKKNRIAQRSLLLETDAEHLLEKLPLAQHFTAVIDGQWLKHDVTLRTMLDGESSHHKPTWCKEFVIGDTAHDGTILKARILDHPQVLGQLKQACTAYLTPSETQRLLSAYGLEDADSSQGAVATRLLELASELRFYLPVLAAHGGWKSSTSVRQTHRYHFHILNPIKGEFTGIASHELDVAYLLQNFNDHLDGMNQRLALRMADKFISFVSGESWASEGHLVVFGPSDVEEVAEEVYDAKYRKERGNVLQSIDANKLWLLAEAWQGVRKEEVCQTGLTQDNKL